jgi:hypothetical protein
LYVPVYPKKSNHLAPPARAACGLPRLNVQRITRQNAGKDTLVRYGYMNPPAQNKRLVDLFARVWCHEGVSKRHLSLYCFAI